MQLAIRDSGVETNGVIGEESSFTIAMNPKMFKVLSDTMYQDKVGSIVREISCNAADAHIAAGCPERPFDIHLPNAMEPWFAVRDTGIGLSDSDIREMYTTYGESTKDTTNDMTGAFGLGGKTPFAYTDQFTVTSIFDGMKRVYVAVIQRGLPVINLQDERPTDEPNGLEVHIGVNAGDYDEWNSAVLNQLKFFTIKPTLSNNLSGIEFFDVWNSDRITFQHELLTMFDGHWKNPVDGLTIVQGGVGYPVDLDKLTGLTDDIKKFATAIASKGAFTEVEIGTISVTTNRESISYEPSTIAGIIKTLTDISTTMCAETVKDILAHDTLWDRCVTFNKQIPVLQDAIMVTLMQTDSDLFAGAQRGHYTQKIALGMDDLYARDLKAVVVKKYEFRRRNHSSAADWKLQRVETGTPDTSQQYSRYSNNEGTLLYPNDDYIIVIKDTNSKPVARMRAYMEDNDFPEIVLIEAPMRGVTEATPSMVAKAMGMDVSKVLKLSDWEAPKVTRDGRSTDRRPRAWQYPVASSRYGYNDYNSKDWSPITDDLDDIGAAIWISMDRHDISHSDDSRQVMTLIREGKITLPLIVVNQSTKKRIEDGKVGADFITPTEAMDEIRKEVESVREEFKQYMRLTHFTSKITSLGVWSLKDDINHPILNKVGKIVVALETIKERLDSHNMPLSKIIDTQSDIHAGSERGEKVAAKIHAEFPMLRHLGSYWNDSDTVDALNYIKLVQGA